MSKLSGKQCCGRWAMAVLRVEGGMMEREANHLPLLILPQPLMLL